MKVLDLINMVKDLKKLPAGTECAIVLESDGTTYKVEFIDFEGETIDVLTTYADMIVLVDNP